MEPNKLPKVDKENIEVFYPKNNKLLLLTLLCVVSATVSAIIIVNYIFTL